MTRLFCTFFLSLIFHVSFSQSSKITGSIKDTTVNAGVKNAVVALLTPRDSVLVKFVRTGLDGSYSINGVDTGNYIVMVLHPQFADYVDNINISGEAVTLPAIPLTSKSKLLEAVILKSGTPIKIKGDTTIYTADSFKVSANANVEELLKKLPGIQVDKNGQITAMGKTVEKVLVDGEEFFGDDPGMAVKNLRADAVKEVQVFDKKSEQSEFTGIDDGQTQKTINLKLKEDKKKGYFGKIDAAGGPQDQPLDDRYNTNLMYSTFKGKRKLSAFLLSGNTGQDGLSWQDNEKFGGNDDISMSMDEDGGMMYMWSGGNSDEEPQINTQDGLLKNVNAGLQYSNKWDDKKTLNFSPKYNEQDYVNNKLIYKQEQIYDSLSGRYIQFDENSKLLTNVDRYNIKLRGSYDIKIDSANSLKITANANFYNTNSSEIFNSLKTEEGADSVNSRTGTTNYSNEKVALSGNAIFRHKFKKARRTLSINADWSLLDTEGVSYNKSKNEIYKGLNAGVEIIDQMLEFTKSTNKVTARGVYTEPLNKKLSLELAYEFTKNAGVNDQKTFSKPPGSLKYEQKVDSLTNEFDQDITLNKPSFKINYSYKKLKYNFGAGFGLTKFDFIDKTLNEKYNRYFTNFFPAATLTYSYKSNHSLRFNYGGYTTQPTMNQLQPLRNNNDRFNQYIGNPDLKPSFSNTFSISHNGYDFIKDRWMYQSLNVSTTSNAIKNNRVYDIVSGESVTQPINTNGNISVNFWSGIGFKSKKLNTRFNVNPNLTYSKFADVINNVVSYSRNTNAGLGVHISKTKDKKYDFSVSNNFSYNSNKNSQSNEKFNYNSNTAGADATVYFDKVWSIQTDYQFFYRQDVNNTGSINNHLWNARLQRTFNKNEFTAYIRIRDILNDNIGITRSYTGNTFTETQNDRLKRYWMIGFTWDFKTKAPAAK